MVSTQRAGMSFRTYSSRIPAETQAIPAKIARSFPQSLQENLVQVPSLGYDRFLPNPCHFIIHTSSYHLSPLNNAQEQMVLNGEMGTVSKTGHLVIWIQQGRNSITDQYCVCNNEAWHLELSPL
jgi:hypothetical protein